MASACLALTLQVFTVPSATAILPSPVRSAQDADYDAAWDEAMAEALAEGAAADAAEADRHSSDESPSARALGTAADDEPDPGFIFSASLAQQPTDPTKPAGAFKPAACRAGALPYVPDVPYVSWTGPSTTDPFRTRFGTFTQQVTSPVPGGGVLIYDLVMPETAAGTPVQPAGYVVLVHGGGGWQGCRDEVAQMAKNIAASHVPGAETSDRIGVIVPDYRLSCVKTTEVSTTEAQNRARVQRLCGFPYTPAINDDGGDDLVGLVQQLITPTEAAGSNLKTTINAQLGTSVFVRKPVVVMGSSAGGSLALQSLEDVGGEYTVAGADPSLYRGVVSVSGAGAKGYYFRDYDTPNRRRVCNGIDKPLDQCAVEAAQLAGCTDPGLTTTPYHGLYEPYRIACTNPSPSASPWDAAAPSWTIPATPADQTMKNALVVFGNGPKEITTNQSLDIVARLAPDPGSNYVGISCWVRNSGGGTFDGHGFELIRTDTKCNDKFGVSVAGQVAGFLRSRLLIS